MVTIRTVGNIVCPQDKMKSFRSRNVQHLIKDHFVLFRAALCHTSLPFLFSKEKLHETFNANRSFPIDRQRCIRMCEMTLIAGKAMETPPLCSTVLFQEFAPVLHGFHICIQTPKLVYPLSSVPRWLKKRERVKVFCFCL